MSDPEEGGKHHDEFIGVRCARALKKHVECKAEEEGSSISEIVRRSLEALDDNPEQEVSVE